MPSLLLLLLLRLQLFFRHCPPNYQHPRQLKKDEASRRRSRGNNRGREWRRNPNVGLLGGQVQSLPQMYVGAFRRWIGNSVTTDDDNDSDNDSDDTRIKAMEAIPGAGGHDKTAGWVDPTTTNELWRPNDLDSLQARPTRWIYLYRMV